MRKEMLTAEICRKDLMHQLKYEIITCIINCICLVLSAGFFTIFLAIINTAFQWAGIVWLIVFSWLFPAGFILFTVCHWLSGKKRILTQEPFVVKTKLLSICEMERRHYRDRICGPWRFRHTFSHSRYPAHYDRFVFHFSAYDRYAVPEKNFSWSELYHMSDEGLNNYSICGDEFYLIIDQTDKGKQRIAYAYPAKLFEWRGAEISESHE